MPRFEDENGVTWDIKLSSTTVDPGATTAAYFAGVLEESEADYKGKLVDSDFEPPGHPGERVLHPAGGNPILSGPGAENAAVIAIRRFAADANNKKILTKPKPKPKPEGSGLPWYAWLAIAYGGYRLIKRSTGGRFYRG